MPLRNNHGLFKRKVYMIDIYKMKLHDRIMISPSGRIEFDILRVPGGWIYTNTITSGAVLVPFNNEFQEEATGKINLKYDPDNLEDILKS
jgi:hypothetical protein